MNHYGDDLIHGASNADMADTIGGRLSRAREAMGLSTAQLARRLGVKTATLSAWENDRAEPRSNKLAMLAGIVNVSPTWLLIGRGAAPIDENGNRDELRLLKAELTSLHRTFHDCEHRLATVLERIDILMRSSDSDERNLDG